jgi:hypothetical protein
MVKLGRSHPGKPREDGRASAGEEGGGAWRPGPRPVAWVTGRWRSQAPRAPPSCLGDARGRRAEPG